MPFNDWSFCGNSNQPNHSSSCFVSTVVISLDTFFILYCIIIGFFKKEKFVSLHKMKYGIRVIELFSVYLVGFLFESWVVEAANRDKIKPYEIALIISKSAFFGAYLIVTAFLASTSNNDNSRQQMHAWPLPVFMITRLTLYFIFYFPWSLSQEPNILVYYVVIFRSIFRVILLFICMYQVFYSVFMTAVADNNDDNVINNSDVPDDNISVSPLAVLKKALLIEWRKRKLPLLALLFFGITGGAFQVLTGWIIGDVINSAISDRVALDKGLMAIGSLFAYFLCSFFDQWFRNLLSQRLVQHVCIEVYTEQSQNNYTLLTNNFLEIKYLFQYNFFDSFLAILKIILATSISFIISWNLTILHLFLIPVAIPFKMWEIFLSEQTKKKYSLAQQSATKIDVLNKYEDIEPKYQKIYNIVFKTAHFISAYNQMTKLVLALSLLVFIWLADVYKADNFLPIFFLASIIGSALNDFSENIVHIYQTISSAPDIFKQFVEIESFPKITTYPWVSSYEEEIEEDEEKKEKSQNDIQKQIYTILLGFLIIIFVGTVLGLLIYQQQFLPEDCDVAIIGAGVGGLWTANRLQKQRPDLTVCLFESRNKTGGRIRTLFFDGAPNIPLELGSMQFQKSHKMVFDAVQRFNLSYFPRIFPSENFNYLRGTMESSSKNWSENSYPYIFSQVDMKLLRSIRDGTPYDLLRFVFSAANINATQVKDWNSCDWANWKATSTWKDTNRKNYNLGWWFACLQVLSEEAVAAYQDVSGYDSFAEQSNLVDVISYIVPSFAEDNYDVDESYYRFTDGYESLSIALENEFIHGGGIIQFGKTLQSIISTEFSNNNLLLTFNDSSSCHAHDVILSLPKQAIDDLINAGPQLESEIGRNALESVFSVPAFKCFLSFDTAWWTKFNFSTGLMHTTLPSRKIYYWGIESDPNNNNAVLMATYGDDVSSTYWSNLIYEHIQDDVMVEPFYFRPNPFMNNPPTSYIDIYGPDSRAVVVRDLMQQIRIAHNDVDIPDPYGGIFMDWSHEGAWHSWFPGVISTNVRQNLRNLSNNNFGFNTYICGEAYSDMQGWVEGALRSCEKLLIEKFNISSDYDDYLACA